jgi:hypothetical protein
MFECLNRSTGGYHFRRDRCLQTTFMKEGFGRLVKGRQRALKSDGKQARGRMLH